MSLSYLKMSYFIISHVLSDNSNSFSEPILHWDIYLLYEALPRKSSKHASFLVSLFASLNFCIKGSYVPDETCLNQDLFPVNIEYKLLNINGKMMLLLRYQSILGSSIKSSVLINTIQVVDIFITRCNHKVCKFQVV